MVKKELKAISLLLCAATICLAASPPDRPAISAVPTHGTYSEKYYLDVRTFGLFPEWQISREYDDITYRVGVILGTAKSTVYYYPQPDFDITYGLVTAITTTTLFENGTAQHMLSFTGSRPPAPFIDETGRWPILKSFNGTKTTIFTDPTSKSKSVEVSKPKWTVSPNLAQGSTSKIWTLLWKIVPFNSTTTNTVASTVLIKGVSPTNIGAIEVAPPNSGNVISVTVEGWTPGPQE